MIPRKYLPEDRLRQRICQGSPELRALASKLEQAYINKARDSQLAEQRLEQQRLEEERRQEMEQFERERLFNLEMERKEVREDSIKKLRYQKDLDEQLKMLAEERGKIFEQFLAEKAMIDKVVAKIQKENEENIMRKIQMKQETQSHIEKFKESQLVWRQIEEERLRKENEDIRRFLHEKEIRDKEFQRIESERRSLKNDHVLRLSEDIQKQREEKLEKEEILQELLRIRMEEKERLREEADMEMEIRRKIDLRNSNMLASKYRMDNEAKEKEEEEKWKIKMMEKFAEDDRIEQMNAQRQRMKREEHKRTVQALLQAKHEKKMKEMEDDRALLTELQEEQTRQTEMLNEERRRILTEHFNQLKGYLPKGLLTQNDLNLLGEQLKL